MKLLEFLMLGKMGDGPSEGTCVVTGGAIRDWEGLGEATVNAVMVALESATVCDFLTAMTFM